MDLIRSKEFREITGLNNSTLNYYCILGLVKEAIPTYRGSPRIFKNLEIIYVELIKIIAGTIKIKKKIIKNIRKSGIVNRWQDAISDPYWVMIVDENYYISFQKSKSELFEINIPYRSIQIINFTAICKNFKKEKGGK